MTIKSLTRAAVLMAAVVLAPDADTASIPLVKNQAPGYFKIMVGGAQVTALYDGSSTFPLTLFKNAAPETLQREVAAVDGDAPKVANGSVNSFLINTGDHLILIDSGGGKLLGPGFGQAMANLKAAGYRPEQVDMILLTHMHRDHIGGLVTDNGQPAFPNAAVWASKPEVDYWLSQANLDGAPSDQQAAFQRARDILAPYETAGRLHSFSYDKDLLPGLKAVALPGHTPGHSGFMLERNGQSILFWGDIVHYSALQFAHPELGIGFDSNSALAIKTRQALLKQVVRQKTLIAGAHITFPGIGYLRADGSQGYRWTPVGFGEVR
ncbi:MBL fold metallo-hydrolase [Sodalis ligni]|uniref:MBL fold metallo-hydrolase n=1 Tax=Sodalis ligni TaxID=2697027 RepID=UPI00193F6931|nr:MBL fold metallo-hydrolase [Sodalis ligni]QWA10585.1 MBL fold metallo-hydrolase [Sodalis ligni]